jgi:HK97 gp10 family phage protein
MIQTEVKLTGDLEAGLSRFEADVKAKVLRAGAGAMAFVMQEEVKQNASRHIKTGTLYNAVYQYHVEGESNENKQTYRVGVNRRKAPHWHLLEYGTSKMPAYPIVRPAYDLIQIAIDAGKARMAEELAK